MIYLDNASTSFPKPPEVLSYIENYLNNFGVSPNRGSYTAAVQADRWVLDAREKLVALIGGSNPHYLAFTQNATYALNFIIKGTLKPGDHVLICSYSHNSVVRPVATLQKQGIVDFTVFEVDPFGKIDWEDYKKKFRPNTKLVIANHASNVLGVISPVHEMAAIAKSKGALFLLDCTQTVGYFPVDIQTSAFDFIAATGHKTLLGPSGVGFLYVKNPKVISSIIEGGGGGEGSLSPYQPQTMPGLLEAGTLNTTAIIGLLGALRYTERVPFSSMYASAMNIIQYAWSQLSEIEEITLYGTPRMAQKVPIISFTIKGILPTHISSYYLKHGNICVRSGLQCAPLVHRTLGTLPTGTVRISAGHQNTFDQVDSLVTLSKALIRERRNRSLALITQAV